MGDLRVDAPDDELLATVGQRILQFGIKILFGDDDVLDLVLMQQILKLAVGNNFRLLLGIPPLLREQDDDPGEQDIADVEMPFLFDGSLWRDGARRGRAIISLLMRIRATAPR